MIQRGFQSASQAALAIALFLAVAAPSWGDCPLVLRSYEDIEGRGFVLEFDPPPPPPESTAQQIAAARILHRSRGEILAFDVFAMVGYGRVLLTRDDTDHTAYFFTEDLRSTPTEADAPLLFIDRLGQADWMHGEDPGRRDHPLGDVIWRVAGCKE
jgi:hypothetical protein